MLQSCIYRKSADNMMLLLFCFRYRPTRFGKRKGGYWCFTGIGAERKSLGIYIVTSHNSECSSGEVAMFACVFACVNLLNGQHPMNFIKKEIQKNQIIFLHADFKIMMKFLQVCVICFPSFTVIDHSLTEQCSRSV